MMWILQDVLQLTSLTISDQENEDDNDRIPSISGGSAVASQRRTAVSWAPAL